MARNDNQEYIEALEEMLEQGIKLSAAAKPIEKVLRDQQGTIRSLQRERDGLKGQNLDLEAVVTTLVQRDKDWRRRVIDQRDQATIQRNEAQRNLEEAVQRRLAIERGLAQTIKQRDEAYPALAKIEPHIPVEVRKENERLQDDNERLRREVDGLKAANAWIRGQLDKKSTLFDKNQRLEKDKTDLQADNDRLREENAKLQSNLEWAQTQLDRKGGSPREVVDEIRRLEKERDDLQGMNSALNYLLDEAGTDNSAQRKAQQSEINRLTNLLANRESANKEENERLRTFTKSLNSENSQLVIDNLHLTQRNERLTRRLDGTIRALDTIAVTATKAISST